MGRGFGGWSPGVTRPAFAMSFTLDFLLDLSLELNFSTWKYKMFQLGNKTFAISNVLGL